MKLLENVCHDEIWTSLKKGHVGSKTRSLGQILEKHCSLMLYYTIRKAQGERHQGHHGPLVNISIPAMVFSLFLCSGHTKY